jgi:hypothetical protein
MNITEMSPEIDARNQVIWAKLVEQCRSGPLPFVKVDKMIFRDRIHSIEKKAFQCSAAVTKQ